MLRQLAIDVSSFSVLRQLAIDLLRVSAGWLAWPVCPAGNTGNRWTRPELPATRPACGQGQNFPQHGQHVDKARTSRNTASMWTRPRELPATRPACGQDQNFPQHGQYVDKAELPAPCTASFSLSWRHPVPVRQAPASLSSRAALLTSNWQSSCYPVRRLRYLVNSGTVWPGVSIQRRGEMIRSVCRLPSVAALKLVWAAPPCPPRKWNVKHG